MIKIKVLNEGFLDKLSGAIKNRKREKVKKSAMSGISSMADRLKFKTSAEVLNDVMNIIKNLTAFSKAPNARQNLLSFEKQLKSLLSQPISLDDKKIQQFIDQKVVVAAGNQKESKIKEQIHQEITQFVSKYAELHGAVPQKPEPEQIPFDFDPRQLKLALETEEFIGGAGDNKPDSAFDPKLLQKGIDKEIHDHGLNTAQASEIAKDELTMNLKDYSKELKEGFDYNKFRDWLNQEIEKKQESNLLIEKNLSKYWEVRAARRAKDAGRPRRSKKDNDWAQKQQNKSTEMNNTIYSFFEKELEESEDILGEIDNMMRGIKNKHKKIKLKREAKKQTLDHPAEATAKRKKGKSLSKIKKPKYGGVAKGFKQNSKDGPTVSPAGSFGPGGSLEEQNKDK